MHSKFAFRNSESYQSSSSITLSNRLPPHSSPRGTSVLLLVTDSLCLVFLLDFLKPFLQAIQFGQILLQQLAVWNQLQGFLVVVTGSDVAPLQRKLVVDLSHIPHRKFIPRMK